MSSSCVDSDNESCISESTEVNLNECDDYSCSKSFNKLTLVYDDDTVPLIDEPTASTALCTCSDDESVGNAFSIASEESEECYKLSMNDVEFAYTGPKIVSVPKRHETPITQLVQ